MSKTRKKKTNKKKSTKFKWLLGGLLLLCLPAKLFNPATLKKKQTTIPLGQVRVTKYTHFEGGRITASGYLLKDEDSHKVCAVGRDWWKKSIPPGTKIWIEGFSYPCVVLDTMAIANSKGLLQTRWVDVYGGSDVVKALNFGIQLKQAYIYE